MKFFVGFFLSISGTCILAEGNDSTTAAAESDSTAAPTTSTAEPVTFEDLPDDLKKQCQENGENKTMCDAVIKKFGGDGNKEPVESVVRYLMNPNGN